MTRPRALPASEVVAATAIVPQLLQQLGIQLLLDVVTNVCPPRSRVNDDYLRIAFAVAFAKVQERTIWAQITG
jgi:hypothetical protein